MINEPVFTITDLLPHLAKEQHAEKSIRSHRMEKI